MRISNPVYLDQAKSLTAEEQERILSRMGGKLPKRLEKDKLSKEEAIAIQLEIEDEQLQEWRERMHAIKAATSKGEKTKSKLKSVPGEAKEPSVATKSLSTKTASAKSSDKKSTVKPVTTKVASAKPDAAKQTTEKGTVKAKLAKKTAGK